MNTHDIDLPKPSVVSLCDNHTRWITVKNQDYFTREQVIAAIAADRQAQRRRAKRANALQNGDKDWDTPCQNCGQLPTVHPTALCGPCCFGEAETAGGNW